MVCKKIIFGRPGSRALFLKDSLSPSPVFQEKTFRFLISSSLLPEKNSQQKRLKVTKEVMLYSELIEDQGLPKFHEFHELGAIRKKHQHSLTVSNFLVLYSSFEWENQPKSLKQKNKNSSLMGNHWSKSKQSDVPLPSRRSPAAAKARSTKETQKCGVAFVGGVPS